MDVMLFVKIICWLIAIGGTLITLFGMWLMMYYYKTIQGKMEVAVMAIRHGLKPTFNWKIALLTTAAWVAIFCFR